MSRSKHRTVRFQGLTVHVFRDQTDDILTIAVDSKDVADRDMNSTDWDARDAGPPKLRIVINDAGYLTTPSNIIPEQS